MVALVALVARGRAAVAFLLAAGAELPADVLLSALSPKLAQMLVVEDGLFLAAGVFPFWVHDRQSASSSSTFSSTASQKVAV